jgi:hypothetical protein
MGELDIYNSKVQMKQSEIQQLNNKLVLFETFRHKYDVKIKEADSLLLRVEELS